MWILYESDWALKRIPKLPRQVIKKYELWKSILRYIGSDKLREFKGFHDEALKGEWLGSRSSRLNLQYRVICSVERKEESIYVEDINPHEY